MISKYKIFLVRETTDVCSQRYLVDDPANEAPDGIELRDVIGFQKVVDTILPENEFQRKRELHAGGIGIVEKIFSSDDYARDLRAMKEALNWDTQPHGHYVCCWKYQ